VGCVKEAVATARETERRKRTGRAVLVAGLCLPKALSPLLPIYLQGVLQVCCAMCVGTSREGTLTSAV
jgi:hypothetical protein